MEGQSDDNNTELYTEEEFASIRSDFAKKLAKRGIIEGGEHGEIFGIIMGSLDKVKSLYLVQSRPRTAKIYILQGRVSNICVRNIPEKFTQSKSMVIKLQIYTEGEDTTKHFLEDPVGYPSAFTMDVSWRIKPRYATTKIPLPAVQKTKLTDHTIILEIENSETKEIFIFKLLEKSIVVRGRGSKSQEHTNMIVIEWSELTPA